MTYAYYNENDQFAAEWLRELIKRGLIADGAVDERDMREIEAHEIRGFTQYHFFAGLGGWSRALRIAGWEDSRPVLTGSPPCQPFSVAGKGRGVDDHRHLAPHFLELVAALRPPFIFGEQVAAAIRKDDWIDDLLDALEDQGYTTGAAVLPACSQSAPHIRQRIWFVGRLADAGSQRQFEHSQRNSDQEQSGLEAPRGSDARGRDEVGRLGNASSERRQQDTGGSSADEAADGGAGRHGGKQNRDHVSISAGEMRGLANSGSQRPPGRQIEPAREECTPSERGGYVGGLANPKRHDGRADQQEQEEKGRAPDRGACLATGTADAYHSGWEDVDWLFCRDGKWRPAQPGLSPLALGLPRGVVPSCDISRAYAETTQEERVGRLRGYGNSIVPQVAAEIIKTIMRN